MTEQPTIPAEQQDTEPVKPADDGVTEPTKEQPRHNLKPGQRIYSDTEGMVWDGSIPVQVREARTQGDWRDVFASTIKGDVEIMLSFFDMDGLAGWWTLRPEQSDLGTADARIHPDWKPAIDWKDKAERLERELAECKESCQCWPDRCGYESREVLRLRQELERAQELHREAEIEARELYQQLDALKAAQGDDNPPAGDDARDCLIVGKDIDGRFEIWSNISGGDGILARFPTTFAECKELADSLLLNDGIETVHIVRIAATAKCVTRLEWEK